MAGTSLEHQGRLPGGEGHVQTELGVDVFPWVNKVEKEKNIHSRQREQHVLLSLEGSQRVQISQLAVLSTSAVDSTPGSQT